MDELARAVADGGAASEGIVGRLRARLDRVGVARLGAIAFAVVLAVTLGRVIATWAEFSHTVDEPAHIAAGTQIFEKGRVEGDLVQAPLARIFVAALPALLSESGYTCRIEREEQLMQCDGVRYWRTLTAARIGTLPFLVLLLVVVWRWGTRVGGPEAGLLAALIVANTPPVLAHAGLATTDIGAAATLSLALFLLHGWLVRPTPGRALAAGAGGALAVATKLSAIAYLPLSAVTMTLVLTVAGPPLAAWRLGLRHLVRDAAAALAVFLVVWWAVYGFALHPFPLAEVVEGVAQLRGMTGQPNYFLGQIRPHGVWYFFPVMLAVKTPLAISALFLIGLAVALRCARGAVLAWAAAAVAILAVAMASRINLGVRHVLPVYPLVALVAASGALALLQHRRGTVVAAALGLWLVTDVALAHPDYLPWFNLAARGEAAYFSADSDFDWGQDAKRLAEELKRRGIGEVAVAMQSNARLRRFGPIRAGELWPGQRVTGWVAVSIGRLLHDRIRPPYTGLRWLLCRRPVALIGRTILLYDIPPGLAARPREACGPGALTSLP